MAVHNKNKTILVTGATGKQGGGVWQHLRQKGFTVRALTRDPEKPAARALEGHGGEVVRGDLSDRAGIERVLEDVFGVFSVQTFDHGVEQEIQEGKNLADAANRQGVEHFIYSSVWGADQQTGIPHFDSKGKVEEHLRRIGMSYTILRPVAFMENWLSMREVIEKGVLPQPLTPETRLQMLAVDDIGGFAAQAFEHPAKWAGRAIDLAGDELSMNELTEAFSRVSGHEVLYQQVPWDQFEQQMGDEMAIMYRWFQEHGYHADLADVQTVYPHVTKFNQWLEKNWKLTAAQPASA